MVERYLHETSQGLGNLVGVDPAHFDRAFSDFATSINKQNELWLQMNATAEPPTTLASIWDMRSRYTPADMPEVSALIDAKEAELDAMLDGFGGLSPALKKRANNKMEKLQAEIESLEAQLVDLNASYEAVTAEVEARERALAAAVKMQNSTGPKRAEALAKVVDKIVCHFRYVGAKSFLQTLEIFPVGNGKPSFPIEASPGPGIIQKALYRLYGREGV